MAGVILFDENLEEIGPALISADVETGNSSAKNDIEITSELPSGVHGLYIPGTDAGGIIEYIDAISNKTPTKKMWSWRGLLTQWIICPDSGNDYKTVTNTELNEAIRDILSDVLGGLFSVPSVSTGQTITSFQFDLYTTVLDGLTALCKSVGYKLVVYADKNDDTGKVQPYCKAEPIVTYEGDYDDDSVLELEFIHNGMGYNHMICMGSGELQERLRVDLYQQEDGSYGTTQYYTGFQERQYYYDDNNADTTDKLTEDGLKKFPEISSGNSLTINSSPENLDIGDKVNGRYKAEGISVSAVITKKIYRISGDVTKIEYSVTED